jgi:hypothetical protein
MSLSITPEEEGEHPTETPSKQNSPNVATATATASASAMTDWNSQLPLTQQLRQSLNYEHIYSPNVEWGNVGPAGKITSTWLASLPSLSLPTLSPSPSLPPLPLLSLTTPPPLSPWLLNHLP